MTSTDQFGAARRTTVLLAAFVMALLFVAASPAMGHPGEGDLVECQYDNPSFELGPGLENNPVSGWTGAGNFGLGSGLVSHARRSLWLYGPFNGSAGSSRVFCLVECYGSWSHRLKIDVGHLGDDPLVGAARVAFTVRWRDEAGVDLDQKSVILLNSLDPTDEMFTVERDFGPAPLGTRSMELEFSFLQTVAQETGRGWLDAFRFDRAIPEVDQWGDFGSRRIDFSGYEWRVKNTYQGPGPNQYSDSPDVVRTLANGSLYMGIDQQGGWRCCEVVLEDHLGYGTYQFVTRGRVDQLDPNIVFGLFIWEYVNCYESSVMWWNPPNEFDIEFSRWGDPGAFEGQFVAQPYDWPGNIKRFDIPDNSQSNQITSEFRWAPEGMYCRAWLGGEASPDEKTLLQEWFYDGPHHPRPGNARVHLNLWLLNGLPPQDGQPAGVQVEEFTFTPIDGPTSPCIGDLNGDAAVDSADVGLLVASWGECPPKGDCLADLTDDGEVNAADLGLLIGGWGRCPQ